MPIPSRKLLLALALVLPAPPSVALPLSAQPAPPTITVSEPVRRHVTEWEEHVARLEPSARVELRPRVSGQVERVHCRDGQLVQASDLLFTLDRRPFDIAAESARAEVARAEAKQELARTGIERTNSLVRDRFAPQAQLDTRRAAQREAEAGIAEARARLRQAELERSWAEVRAPQPGRVSDRRVDAGNLVQAGETLLTTILALDPIYAGFDLSEADLLRYDRRGAAHPGGAGAPEPVQLRLADEAGWEREGRLDFLDTALDRRSGTIRAHATIANPGLLLTPGSFARLRLRAGEGDVLMVPDAAIAADQAARVVMTVSATARCWPSPSPSAPWWTACASSAAASCRTTG